jgi:hypothetical protein
MSGGDLQQLAKVLSTRAVRRQLGILGVLPSAPLLETR